MTLYTRRFRDSTFMEYDGDPVFSPASDAEVLAEARATACQPCQWVRVSRKDDSSDGEAANLFTDWCSVCGALRIIHEGDYSWWGRLYVPGTT